LKNQTIDHFVEPIQEKHKYRCLRLDVFGDSSPDVNNLSILDDGRRKLAQKRIRGYDLA
jgi:hypothetical protein